MIAALLLLQAVTAAPLSPPADWTALPPLPFAGRRPDFDHLAGFVRDEVAAGRCVAPPPQPDGTVRLTVELALFVDRAGTVRRIVPRAIGCPTVEQYAVGVVASGARGNIAPPAGDGWFRLAAPFAWR